MKNLVFLENEWQNLNLEDISKKKFLEDKYEG